MPKDCQIHITLNKPDFDQLNEIASHHGDRSMIVRKLIQAFLRFNKNNKVDPYASAGYEVAEKIDGGA